MIEFFNGLSTVGKIKFTIWFIPLFIILTIGHGLTIIGDYAGYLCEKISIRFYKFFIE